MIVLRRCRSADGGPGTETKRAGRRLCMVDRDRDAVAVGKTQWAISSTAVLLLLSACARPPEAPNSALLPPTCPGKPGVALAFAALQGEDRTDIFGLDAAGRAVQLTEGGLSDNPTFSPGGTEILFTRESEKRVAGEDPHRSLWLMDSDGYNERPLIADCYDELEMARYSPDGKTIALVGIIDPPQSEHRVFTMNADGTSIRQLSGDSGTSQPESDFAVAWSPDGENLAFMRLTGTQEKYISQIWVADARTGEERLVSEGDKNIGALSWSPAGDALLFTQVLNTIDDSVVVAVSLDLGSGETSTLAEGVISPVYSSANGSQILYWTQSSVDDAVVLELETTLSGVGRASSVVTTARVSPASDLAIAACAVATG